MKTIFRCLLLHLLVTSTVDAVRADDHDGSRFAYTKTLTDADTHLVFPVVNSGERFLLEIRDGEKLLQNMRVALPREGDAYWLAPYPLEHFDVTGKTLTVKPDVNTKLDEQRRFGFDLIRFGNDLPDQAAGDYAKPYRNQFHPSARRGWNNDVNGMVYHNGKYHLYFQYNPLGISWGNKHWGHFEGTDLVHWEEKPIPLYMRTVEDKAFSGGGFVDVNNSAGFGKNALFVVYTSTGRGECIAYSKDNGLTFEDLPDNPVVKHEGRDPKIVWYGPEQKWVMVVFDMTPCAETKATPSAVPGKGEDYNFAFYESKDLRTWKRTGAFTDPDRDAVFECPELFEAPVRDAGGRPTGETRWILYGAANRCFVGRFNGETFVKESGPHGTDHGDFKAAQVFSNAPKGRRIQVGWARPEAFTELFPDQLCNQSFTLPHELTLRQTGDSLRVFFTPVAEVEALRDRVLAEGKELDAAGANQLLQKCKGELSEVVIEFARKGTHEIIVNGIDASFEGREARIFTDVTFNEVYADGGFYYEVRAREAADFRSTKTALALGHVKRLKVYRLRSIWKQTTAKQH